MTGLLVRWLHIGAMSLLLGGGLLVFALSIAQRGGQPAPADAGRLPLLAGSAYEFLFWPAVALVVASGIGNLGAYGAALPGPASGWGARLALKLGGVLLLLLLSLLRSLLCIQWRAGASSGAPPPKLFSLLYGGTFALLLAILYLAVSLAHA